MKRNMRISPGLAVSLLFCGVLLAGLSAEPRTTAAQECIHTIMGVCTVEDGFQSCSPPEHGWCYTVKQRDYPYKNCSCLSTPPTASTPAAGLRPDTFSTGVGSGGDTGNGSVGGGNHGRDNKLDQDKSPKNNEQDNSRPRR